MIRPPTCLLPPKTRTRNTKINAPACLCHRPSVKSGYIALFRGRPRFRAMDPLRPAPSRGRLRWTLRMPRPVAVRDAGAACLAGGRQWPQGGAGCTAAPARGREPPPAWNSRARRAGGMGDAPQSRAQRRGNAARHGRCSLPCAGCWTERNPREASARQTPVTVKDDRE
jgi:hypothetical protein